MLKNFICEKLCIPTVVVFPPRPRFILKLFTELLFSMPMRHSLNVKCMHQCTMQFTAFYGCEDSCREVTLHLVHWQSCILKVTILQYSTKWQMLFMSVRSTPMSLGFQQALKSTQFTCQWLFHGCLTSQFTAHCRVKCWVSTMLGVMNGAQHWYWAC